MPDKETIFEWIKQACNLHPDTQDMDAVRFGEFEFIARCAYMHGRNSIMHLETGILRKRKENESKN